MAVIYNYSLSCIANHIANYYNISKALIKRTTSGGDNSVYRVFDEDKEISYSFKIYEGRSTSSVVKLFDELVSISKFIRIPVVISPSEGNRYVSLFGKEKKPCVLLVWVEGLSMDINTYTDIFYMAEFIARIHGSVPSLNGNGLTVTTLSCIPPYTFTGTYLNSELLTSLKTAAPERYIIYKHFLERYTVEIENDVDLCMLLYRSIGFCHGDCTPDNIIRNAKYGGVLIDFDHMSLNGCQVTDLVSYISKSKLLEFSGGIRTMLDTYGYYMNDRFYKDIDEITIYKAIYSFSVLLLASTDYYTYKVKKISPYWISINYADTFNRLLKSIEIAGAKLTNTANKNINPTS